MKTKKTKKGNKTPPKREPSADWYNYSAESALKETLAAFSKAADKYELSIFQASWVALGVIKEINGFEGPFGIVKAEDMVYPQYPLPSQKAKEWEDSEEWQKWVCEKTKELLKDVKSYTHHDVVEHWKQWVQYGKEKGWLD